MKALYRYPATARPTTLDLAAKLDILQADNGAARLVLSRADGEELPSLTINLTAEEAGVIVRMLTPKVKT